MRDDLRQGALRFSPGRGPLLAEPSSGVTAPSSTLLDLAGRRVLVVDRFDRAHDGSRIGCASAMTMLEARDGDHRTHLEIAEVVEERSARATDELRELWRLAPAFDLDPDPRPGPVHLST